MRKKWRLSNSVTGYVVTNGKNKKINLVDTESKPFIKFIEKKLSGINNKKIEFTDNTFEIFFKKDENYENVSIFIKNKDLGDWHLLENSSHTNENFVLISTQMDVSKGKVSGRFEIATTGTPSDGICLFSTEMKEYSKAFDEFKRKLSTEISTKTKKWIPGHRYDDKNNTVLYLGDFLANKVNDSNSTYSENAGIVSLYVTSLKDGEKSVEDVLKNRTFGFQEDDIRTLYKKSPMVDFGEVLVPLKDSQNISTFRSELLKTSINKSKIVGKYEASIWTAPQKVFDVYSYDVDSSTKVDPVIKDVIKDLMFDKLLNCWNINASPDNFIGTNGTDGKNNSENLIRRTLLGIPSLNANKLDYYKKFFEYLFPNDDILNKTSEELLNNWDESVIFNNFDNYLKYNHYLNTHYLERSTLISNQRVNSSYYRLNQITIEDLLGPGSKLKEVIVDLIEESKNNGEFCVDKLDIINVGTKSDPKTYYSITVSLDNVIDYLGGVDKIDEDLKTEIMDKKFKTLIINVDVDKEIQ